MPAPQNTMTNQEIEKSLREMAAIETASTGVHTYSTYEGSVLLAAADKVKQAHYDSQSAQDATDWFSSLIGELSTILGCEPKASAIIDKCKKTKDYIDLYKKEFSNCVEACSFIQEEHEELGLRLGDNITTTGVLALKSQRDQLKDRVGELQSDLEFRRELYAVLDNRYSELVEKYNNQSIGKTT